MVPVREPLAICLSEPSSPPCEPHRVTTAVLTTKIKRGMATTALPVASLGKLHNSLKTVINDFIAVEEDVLWLLKRDSVVYKLTHTGYGKDCLEIFSANQTMKNWAGKLSAHHGEREVGDQS